VVSAASGVDFPLDAVAPLLDNPQDRAAALSKAAEAFGGRPAREAVGKHSCGISAA
jgi:hypothetical protein